MEPRASIAVTVSFRVKPGRAAEFLELLAPVLDAMRHEPSFVNAVLHRDPGDAHRFMLYETWADRTDLVEVQLARPYRQPYMDRLPGLLAEPREIRTFAPLRGDFRFASGAAYSGATLSASHTTAA